MCGYIRPYCVSAHAEPCRRMSRASECYRENRAKKREPSRKVVLHGRRLDIGGSIHETNSVNLLDSKILHASRIIGFCA